MHPCDTVKDKPNTEDSEATASQQENKQETEDHADKLPTKPPLAQSGLSRKMAPSLSSPPAASRTRKEKHSIRVVANVRMPPLKSKEQVDQL